MLICFDDGLENRKREWFSIFLFLILNLRHNDFHGLLYFTPEICFTLSDVVDTASGWRIFMSYIALITLYALKKYLYKARWLLAQPSCDFLFGKFQFLRLFCSIFHTSRHRLMGEIFTSRRNRFEIIASTLLLLLISLLFHATKKPGC